MKKQKVKKPAKNECLALVPADTQAIRNQLLKKLKSAERRFQKAEAEHLQHREVDVPEYQRWHHVTLGPLEQEIHGAHQEFRLFDSFLVGLSQEQSIQGRPVRKLLAQLLSYAEMRNDGRESNHMNGEWSPAFLMECAVTLWLKPREKALREQEEQWRRQREAREQARAKRKGHRNAEEEWLDSMLSQFDEGMFGGGEDEENDWTWDGPAAAPRSRKLDKESDREFRALYRRLCRALHPDVAGAATPEMHRLWLEVQEAHDAGDLERLEALYAAWEMKVDPQAKQGTTCARIIAATQQCLAGLRSLQRDLRAVKKHLSWQFSARDEAERARQAKQMAQALRREALTLNAALERIRSEYRRLLVHARQPAVRKSSKPTRAWENENQIRIPL